MSFKSGLIAFLMLGTVLAQAAETPKPPPPTPASGAVDKQSPFSDPDLYTRNLYPFHKAVRAPKVLIDVTDAPEVRPWAEHAQQLAQEWWPHLTQLLSTEGLKPKKTLTLVFKRGIDAPAYASGGNITIKVEWITQHPDDFGMVIHELTHIVQSYGGRRGNRPGWLVEGIADYVRWWRYEPEAPRTPIRIETAKYTDSYRTTAWFLAWITGKYNRSLVALLDRALRDGTYSDDLFKTATGKTVDELWSEFLISLPPRK